MRPKIKICGITSAEEIQLLDKQAVSYAGLWHGIPQGRYNLELPQLVKLASEPTSSLKFLMVTMSHDFLELAKAIEYSGIKAIQFHGFHLPAFITKIKQTFGDDVKLFKVLHAHNNRVLEGNLIERYVDAGTDFFILDYFQDKHRIGSTGNRLDDRFMENFFNKWKINEQTMIAGGVDETCLDGIYDAYKPYGFDIDSAARTHGLICKQRVGKIMQPPISVQYA